MNRILLVVLLPVVLLTLAGCDRQDSDGPPTVSLGDSVCAQCNMIISDERWATATMIDGPRGPEPRWFDDFNCQVNYEVEHPDETVLTRWSCSHATREWVRTADAHFLISPDLRTPMASKVAAFASLSEADAVKAELSGEVVGFEAAWRHLGFVAHGN